MVSGMCSMCGRRCFCILVGCFLHSVNFKMMNSSVPTLSPNLKSYASRVADISHREMGKKYPIVKKRCEVFSSCNPSFTQLFNDFFQVNAFAQYRFEDIPFGLESFVDGKEGEISRLHPFFQFF